MCFQIVWRVTHGVPAYRYVVDPLDSKFKSGILRAGVPKFRPSLGSSLLYKTQRVSTSFLVGGPHNFGSPSGQRIGQPILAVNDIGHSTHKTFLPINPCNPLRLLHHGMFQLGDAPDGKLVRL